MVGATQEEGENDEVADPQPPPGGTVEADAYSNRSFGSCIIIYVIFTLSLSVEYHMIVCECM